MEIVEDLIRKSKEFDPDPEGKGINIVYFASKAKAAQAPSVDQAVDDGFDDGAAATYIDDTSHNPLVIRLIAFSLGKLRPLQTSIKLL